MKKGEGIRYSPFLFGQSSRLTVSVHGKCLTGTQWKEFKEWIREVDLHPVFGSHVHRENLPTGKGAPPQN